ncbi:MAG: sigma-70 family RNA polymerase sigma factor [Planctomycetes bacterium]|nr:sigma-70 family RNA polymerase sigma factor [Planctomycetota bacterium]
MMPDDVRRVEAARSGDRPALERLLAERGRVAAAAIASCVRGREDAEDLLQETFLRAVRGIAGLRDAAKFDSWLYGIGRRVALEGRHQTKAAPLMEVAAAQEPGHGDGGEKEGRMKRLREAVDRLPGEYRATLTLFYQGGRSYQEIADLTGLSRAAVNQRLTRARAILRESLGLREGGCDGV